MFNVLTTFDEFMEVGVSSKGSATSLRGEYLENDYF